MRADYAPVIWVPGRAEASADNSNATSCPLRALCTLGVVSLAAVSQSDTRGVGETQVQARSTSHDPGQSVPATAGCAVPGSVRSLAHRYDLLVCLTGAE